MAVPAPNAGNFVDPLLHPISLRYPLDSHEDQYLEAFAALRSFTYDRKAWCICAAVHVAYSLMIGWSTDALLPCYSAVLGLHAVMLYRSRAAAPLAKHRTARLIASRLLADAILSRGLPRWGQPVHITGWGSMTKHCLLSTGIFSLWWQAFMYVLPLKWMLLTQAAALVLIHRGMTPSCCTALLKAPLGRTVIAYIWKCIQLARGATSHLGSGDPLDLPAAQRDPRQPQLACLSSILMLQLALGYALPVLVLYFLEHRERLNFWAASCGLSARAVAEAAHISATTKVAAAAVVAVAVVGTWECLLVLQYSNLLAQ